MSVQKKYQEMAYRAEKSRGTKHQKDIETLILERLKRETVDLLISHRCKREQYETILRSYGLEPGSEQFRFFLGIYDQWSGKGS